MEKVSDLISRSELIMCLSDYALQESPNDNESTGEQRISKMIYDAIQNCISCVEEQPTAYSVDKVVEELEGAMWLTTNDDGETNNLSIQVVSFEDAIEIVKQDGVSDDECEWKYTKEIMDNAEFKVGCNQNALKRGIVPNNFSYHDFKYCPYCGKKIKVVE